MAQLLTAIILVFLGNSVKLLQPSITIPVCVLISVLAARFLYKKKLVKTIEKIED